MGRRAGRHCSLGRFGALALLVLPWGCTGGGADTPPANQGGGNGSQGQLASWNGQLLTIVESTPLDRAIQVELEPVLRVRFDGDLAAETLEHPDTVLTRAHDGTEVQVSRSVAADRREARFEPAQALDPATDYVLTLAPLTADQDGRVLDRLAEIRFRTEDDAPPAIDSWSCEHPGHALGPDRGVLLVFDEELQPESVLPGTVQLRATDGRPIDMTLEVDDDTVHCAPTRDVAGSTDVIVSVRGVRDRSGNRMDTLWSTPLRTAPDAQGPRLLTIWPDSPSVRPGPRAPVRATFDESLVGASPDTQYIAVDTRTAAPLPYKAFPSADARTIHFLPTSDIPIGTTVEIRPNGDGLRAVDAGGNAGDALPTLGFQIGEDRDAPRPVVVHPADGQSGFPVWGSIRVRFDDVIDEASLDVAKSALRDDEGCLVEVELPRLDPSGTEIVLTPSSPLRPDALYAFTLPALLDGIRDLAGNPMATSVAVSFRTHPQTTPPSLVTFPGAGAVGVALDAQLALVCDEDLAPVTDPRAVTVLRPDGTEVDGSWTAGARPDTLRFAPQAPWTAGMEHRIVVRAGPDGLHTASGLTWPQELSIPFRTGYRNDLDPPAVEILLAGIAGHHAEGRVLAPAGFTLTVADPAQGDPSFDPTACDLEILGPTGAILAAEIARDARATASGLTYRIPIASPLPVGIITVRATAADLSGNRSTTAERRFEVVTRTTDLLPFETTQVVWVRTDLDRDGNGRADFDDDLYRLGLLAPGDPIGQNDRMRAILADGVLARARQLYGRDRNGAPVGPDPVPIRLSLLEPLGVAHMQIACGGFDPEGPSGRSAGDSSTGILGRAWYDYRNESTNERNTSQDPGLGVFPAELWLFETRVHRDVYPSFVTSYAQLFLGLAPDLGGTPAGLHPRDAEALAPGFDPSTGNAPAAARYHAIFAAADAWATAVGTVLAHEIGHSIGLTATGADAAGLHGDASLHNVAASSRDVMASALGFDALMSLSFRFRPLNDAYLRQAVMLR
jgi:hypothetical protein